MRNYFLMEHVPLAGALLLQLILVVMNFPCQYAATLGNETDMVALFKFREKITEDPLGALLSWNHSLHFCQWRGVTCSRRHQRVTIIDLHSVSLVGSISPYIGNLSFLKGINLRNNSFHGSIPQEISLLFRLQHLNFTSNLLEGDVPRNLSHCPDLRVIDFNENKLVGTVPEDYFSLSKLVILGLATNNLTGTIPPSLGNFSSLARLSLARNVLEGSIPPDLGRIATLAFLQLSANKLTGIIPPSIYNLSSIYLFSVASNQLHGNLPPNLGFMWPSLQRLLVGSNTFTGPIPPSLSNSTEVLQLDFSDNGFNGSIPENIGHLGSLLRLNFGRNRLGAADGTDDLNFITSMTNCSGLEILAFDGNNLTGSLPNSVGNLSTTLRIFTMGGNNIYGSIPEGLEHLLGLTLMGMEQNRFSGVIHSSLGKLQHLQILALDGNNFSGEIPRTLGNLTLLNYLLLTDNNLRGSIPSNLGQCEHLTVLNLSQNNLSGPIPIDILRLSSLSLSLILSRNHLSGEVSSEMGKLVNLRELDISNNYFTGEIPSTLGSCLSLEIIKMEGNFFNGLVPESLIALKGMEYIDLSRNNLSGRIPSYLENFRFLYHLNLSFNNFQGNVPIDGIFKNMSGISIQGNGDLCGGIPQLELPPCAQPSRKKSSNSRRTIIIITSIFSSLLLISCLCCLLYYLRKLKKKEGSQCPSIRDGHLEISYGEILRATDRFSRNNLLGTGNYGSVYKGVLEQDGKMIAVKVLDLKQRGAEKSFMAECNALRNIRHRNLLRILTTCSSLDFAGHDFKALVFEYMPNGNLDEWLHPKDDDGQNRCLTFMQRLNIAIDVAYALDYLHSHLQTPIVHCDLKPSNVLLGIDMVAHVADFGLARFLRTASHTSSRDESTSTIGLTGTFGYVAPEYGLGEEVSIQGDVYSYGILLLEMFTGKRPTDNMFVDGLNLHKFVMEAFSGQFQSIVDPVLLKEKPSENQVSENTKEMHGWSVCFTSIIKVGLSCSSESPRLRMDMKKVLSELISVKNKFTNV